ncbi:hypothetical protein [Sorangium sp. So ce233]|uniref:hypothetical protein n=1 Tax=Sorangium sp. So ce233 TaxID=3133290 RepID=UPI003F635B39
MAVTEGKPWRFEQLGGAKRILVLAGWAAPFGGPRVGAVVRTPIEVRAERVYYPGSQTPTRHIFGEKYPDWELRGRFRDRAPAPFGGTGFAKRKTEEVRSFVKDKQIVTITWGDILVASRALIVSFDPGYEAEREVEWVLRIEIDALEDSANPGATAARSRPPQNYIHLIRESLAVVGRKISLLDLPGEALEALDSIFGVVNRATADMELALLGVQAFRDAPFAAVARAQETQQAARRGLLQLRETLATIPQDALVFRDSAEATINLVTATAQMELEFAKMLAELAEFERAAQVARAGRAKASYAARTGDTWEGISSQFYGRPDRAADICAANALAAGQNPVPGVEYLIPA